MPNIHIELYDTILNEVVSWTDSYIISDKGTKEKGLQINRLVLSEDIFGIDSCKISCNPSQSIISTLFTSTNVGFPSGRKIRVYIEEVPLFSGFIEGISNQTNIESSDCVLSAFSNKKILVQSCIAPNCLSTVNMNLGSYIIKILKPFIDMNIVSGVIIASPAREYVLSGKGRWKTITTDTTKLGVGSPVPVTDVTKTKTVVLDTGNSGVTSKFYKGIDSSLDQSKLPIGSKVWETIEKLCGQVGLYPFFDSWNNNIYIDIPYYDFPPEALYGDNAIRLNWSGEGRVGEESNIKEVDYSINNSNRYSHYIYGGTIKGGKKTKNTKAVLEVKSPSPLFWHTPKLANQDPDNPRENILYKPYYHKSNTSQLLYLKRQLRNKMEKDALESFNYSVVSPGFLFPLNSPNGVIFFTNTMINVVDERNFIEVPLYIKGIERRIDPGLGCNTVVHLVPPKVWMSFDAQNDQEYEDKMFERIWW